MAELVREQFKDLSIKEIKRNIDHFGLKCDFCVERQEWLDVLESHLNAHPSLTLLDPQPRKEAPKQQGSNSKPQDQKSKRKSDPPPQQKKANKDSEKPKKINRKHKETTPQRVEAKALSYSLGLPEILAITNVLVYLLWCSNRTRRMVTNFLVPSKTTLRRGRFWTMWTTGLVHTSVMPLVHSSMMLLFWGLPLAETISSIHFIVLYFWGALLGNLVTAAVDIYRIRRVGEAHLGSAASIMALMVTFACLFRNAQVSWNGISMKPFQLVLVHGAVDTFISGSNMGSRLSHHIGGVIAGALYSLFMGHLSDLTL